MYNMRVKKPPDKNPRRRDVELGAIIAEDIGSR